MFFYYRLMIPRLIASENPNVISSSKAFVKEFAGDHNVSDLITLSRSHHQYNIPGLRQHHFPCNEAPNDDQLKSIFDIIDGAIARKRSAWVHCEKGYDRSGYVLRQYHIKMGYSESEVSERFEEKARSIVSDLRKFQRRKRTRE